MLPNERPGFSIADLRDRPEFFDILAERLWRAWWMRPGYPLAYVKDRLEENMGASSLPFALVAFRSNVFLGTASVAITSGPDAQPHAPWLANVMVEEDYRRQGIGAALIDQAMQKACLSGIEWIYLTARPTVRAFYERTGWRPVKENIGMERLAILKRSTSEFSEGISAAAIHIERKTL